MKTTERPDIFGIEQECDIIINETGISKIDDASLAILKNLSEVIPSYNRMLVNGGKIYPDMGYIEACTPELSSLEDIPRYMFANEQIVYSLLEYSKNLGMFRTFSMSRRVRDDFGHSWGYHENYLASREAIPKVAIEHLGNFAIHLATRGLYSGAGMVVATPSTKPRFLVSQKTSCIGSDQSSSTIGKYKPLLNQRDEPYIPYDDKMRSLFRRVHVTSMDRVFSPVAMKLGVGSTNLLLKCAEVGISNSNINPIEDKAHIVAVRAANDPNLKKYHETQGYKKISTLAIRFELLDLMARYIETEGGTNNDIWAYETEKKVLEEVENEGVDSLRHFADWALKKYLIERKVGKPVSELAAYSSEELEQAQNIDRQHSNVSFEAKSFNAKLRKIHKTYYPQQDEIDIAEVTPPENTRAKARSAFITWARDNLTTPEEQDICYIRWDSAEFSKCNELGKLVRYKLEFPYPHRSITRVAKPNRSFIYDTVNSR